MKTTHLKFVLKNHYMIANAQTLIEDEEQSDGDFPNCEHIFRI